MLEIKSSDLINKDDFYREQLKKHSVMQFRNQTLDRMRKYDDGKGLADRGRSKNNLASLGSDHLDMITQLEDSKSNNLNEFR